MGHYLTASQVFYLLKDGRYMTCCCLSLQLLSYGLQLLSRYICVMERFVEETADGSHTISIPEIKVTYHSKHGAIQESLHVFINEGLKYYVQQTGKETISILEMGFGTGLNALLSLQYTTNTEADVYFESIEAYPLTLKEVKQLNYCNQLDGDELQDFFIEMHTAEWEKPIVITEAFTLCKKRITLQQYHTSEVFDIIFYDAFAPAAQPDLWTAPVFKNLHALLNKSGILITYCSKGDVRRALLAAGFTVEKVPGPAGKREILRATK
jgi:tRNA U34 5-methylaminomethyl-2-thiouridine-forming methyltransferase MnmC